MALRLEERILDTLTEIFLNSYQNIEQKILLVILDKKTMRGLANTVWEEIGKIHMYACQKINTTSVYIIKKKYFLSPNLQSRA